MSDSLLRSEIGTLIDNLEVKGVVENKPFFNQPKKALVAIPCYNEEKTIGSIILKAKNHADEILVVDEKIRELIINRASVSIIREKAAMIGFKDMRFDGLKKVISGLISVEELLRVTRDTK